MNKDWVLFHLQETKEELDRTILEIKSDPEFDNPTFYVAIQHMYHHLNTAWNSQDETPERTYQGSEKDFHDWRQFPKVFDM